jgi:hypothetical protein
MMTDQYRTFRSFLCIVAPLLLIIIFLNPGVIAAKSPAQGSWKIVASPSPGASSSYFNGVAAISASNVWAVGVENNSSNVPQTLIEHWNGSTWSIVASPGPDPNNNILNGVAAFSASSVWAVGNVGGNNGKVSTLVEYWNGSAWSVVPSPSTSAIENVLNSVVAISATNVWAVGYTNDGTGLFQTLIEHWNGTTWSIVSSPNAGSSENALTSVTAISANDVWAVGFYYKTNSSPTTTLIEHWNGTTWSIVSSPNAGTRGSSLQGVTAICAKNIWAVGFASGQTLIEHWNGTTWSIVSSPNTTSALNAFRGVAAVSANLVWAVGYARGVTPSSPVQTLIEQWNGTRWSIVASPNASSSSLLFAVAGVPKTQKMWAAGSNNGFQTLTEFYTP